LTGFQKNLLWRVATAAFALPALLAAFFLGPAWLGESLIALAALVGLLEFFALLRARAVRPFVAPGLFVAATLFLDLTHTSGAGARLWPLSTMVLLLATLRRAVRLEDTVPAAAATLLGAAYLGGLGGTMAALLGISPREDGAWRIVLLLGIVMASDTLAFFVGHAVGRRRLAPALSPGKTVEGALGGLAGGVIGALVVRHLGLPTLPLAQAVALGLSVAALGIAGDLNESLLKRWAGVKDSGTLFPGHGGMLDRLDSLLFGAPALYYYFSYLH
jgi:phosphatidate cytidylyltransferase